VSLESVEETRMSFRNTLILLLSISTCIGCGESREHPNHDRAVLYTSKRPGVQLLNIFHKQWLGGFGPDGFVGYKFVGYWATIEGEGPVYNNPKFEDNPSGIECIGTIKMDLAHNQVTIDMQRIISKPGEPQRTEPHPSNGIYPIELSTSVPVE